MLRQVKQRIPHSTSHTQEVLPRSVMTRSAVKRFVLSRKQIGQRLQKSMIHDSWWVRETEEVCEKDKDKEKDKDCGTLENLYNLNVV